MIITCLHFISYLRNEKTTIILRLSQITNKLRVQLVQLFMIANGNVQTVAYTISIATKCNKCYTSHGQADWNIMSNIHVDLCISILKSLELI